MRLYLRPVNDPTQYNNAADYPDNPPFPAPEGFEWVEGEPPQEASVYRQLNPLERLEELITQGQIAMEEAPLPDDLQKEIFDLEVFVRNYYRRGATTLIVSAIQGFSIPAERQDVTQGQRAQVEALKAQMLAVFSPAIES